MIKSQRQLL